MSKIYQLWNKEYFLFSFSRAIGILIKPAILYFLISYNFENFADHYSRLLIILISVFSFLGFPYYFNFYKSYFESEKKISIENEIDIYLKDFVVFNFLVMPIIFCLSLIIFENIFLASCCCLLLFFEKILDEVQRFQQYSKKFSSWSVLFLVKNFLPILVSLIVFYFLNTISFEIYLFSMIFTNIALSIFYIRQSYLRRLYGINLNFFASFFKRLVGNNFLIYLLTIFGAFLLQADRFLLSVLSETPYILAEITLMAQIANIIPLVISFGFIANRRQLILQRETNIQLLFLGFLIPVISLILLILIYIALEISINHGFINLSLENHEIILYLASFAILSVDKLLHEHLYWNLKSLYLLAVDVMLFSSFFFLTLFYAEALIYFFFFMSLLRFIIHFLQKKRYLA